MVDKKDLVAVRGYSPADKNFILATWLRGLYYGDTWFKEINKDVFMNNYHKVLEALLDSNRVFVKVACLREDPEVILAYSVLDAEGKVLHWVFCKKAWRQIGIAKSLVPTEVKAVTHLTKVGLSMIRKHSVEFNPFLI